MKDDIRPFTLFLSSPNFYSPSPPPARHLGYSRLPCPWWGMYSCLPDQTLSFTHFLCINTFSHNRELRQSYEFSSRSLQIRISSITAPAATWRHSGSIEIKDDTLEDTSSLTLKLPEAFYACVKIMPFCYVWFWLFSPTDNTWTENSIPCLGKVPMTKGRIFFP